jgi:hypothetical protein
MKRLFCAVITSVDDTLESPLIIHSMSETMDHAEKEVIDYMAGEDFGFDYNMLNDNFDTFIFEVTDILGQDF